MKLTAAAVVRGMGKVIMVAPLRTLPKSSVSNRTTRVRTTTVASQSEHRAMQKAQKQTSLGHSNLV